jgi:hypothetical protein
VDKVVSDNSHPVHCVYHGLIDPTARGNRIYETADFGFAPAAQFVQPKIPKHGFKPGEEAQHVSRFQSLTTLPKGLRDQSPFSGRLRRPVASMPSRQHEVRCKLGRRKFPPNGLYLPVCHATLHVRSSSR